MKHVCVGGWLPGSYQYNMSVILMLSWFLKSQAGQEA
jgi:hypothetical protein